MKTIDSQEKKAYTTLFNDITDSLTALEQAQDILVKAQQAAEEIYISDER